MNTLDGNLLENQLIYHQNLKKNEKVKKYSICLLICGIVFLTIDVLTHSFVFLRLSFRLGACDYDDKEKREKCREKDKKKLKNLIIP